MALPDYVKKLPEKAQKVWADAYSQAKETFTDDDAKARAVADKATRKKGYNVQAGRAPDADDGQKKPSKKSGELEGLVDVVAKGTVASVDEQGMAFGWAYLAEYAGKRLQDHSGQDVPMAELEPAAYSFVENKGRAGEMHVRKLTPEGVVPGDEGRLGQLVESMAFTTEKWQALLPGISDEMLKQAPRGWWIGFRITDEALKAKARTGEYPMFSIGGKAKRRAQLDKVAKDAPPAAQAQASVDAAGATGAAPGQGGAAEGASTPGAAAALTGPVEELQAEIDADLEGAEKWEELAPTTKAYLQLQAAGVHTEFMAKGWAGSFYHEEFVKPRGGGPNRHGRSIKCPDIYEALRREGASKEKAARISNDCAGDPNCNCH